MVEPNIKNMEIKRIKSIGENQQEIIKDILTLYNNGETIDLDCTYSKGVFYKNGIVAEPKFKSDLEPINETIIKADSTALPFDDNSMKCIMFDPPFIIIGTTYKDSKEGSCIMAKRFTGYDNFDSLKKHYKGTIKEAYRLLKNDGILIFKLQNTISSGKQHFTQYYVIKEALEAGFYPKDEFVLEAKSKLTSFGGRWKNQIHALKYHSYFLVFQKKKCPVNYN